MTLQEAIKVLKNLQAHDRRSIIEVDRKAIDTVVSELEKPTYTPADMDSFAEWCSYMGWLTGKDTEMWWNRNYKVKDKTTAQLRELWEEWKAKQGGDVKPLKCIRCGKELDKDKIILNSFGNKDNNPDVVFCSDCEHLNYIEHLQQGKESTE